MLFSAENLDFQYDLQGQRVQALKNVSFNIEEGDFQILMGPSGSGKTTLLSLLGLVEPLQSGRVIFRNIHYTDLSEAQKNEIRRFKIGFIFQAFHLFPVLSAEENVAFFLHRHPLSKSEIQNRVEESLKAVGLWEHRKKRPGEMSGGQKQRVAIARALAKKPEVILADEPTASLDQKTGREIMELFKNLNEEKKISIIISSHDPMVHSYGKKILRLVDGMIEKSNGVIS